jgi:hypothetical protein
MKELPIGDLRLPNSEGACDEHQFRNRKPAIGNQKSAILN